MSTSTSEDRRSAAAHAADQHDLIRVQGARVNNLKDVSIEIPKRRLTVFTGVSGSGKSSLVFSTIAAESQRMINETYSAFVQGFMPTLARPEVDVLDGLTTAIIVDQQRMGADPRSTVGTATDANALLRILFSRLGKPYLGPPGAFSFNVASISGAEAVTIERAGKTVKEKRSFEITGGMCLRCEGRGSVTDLDLTALYDDSKSLNEWRHHHPRLQHGGLVRPHLPRLRVVRPGQADPEVHQEGARRPPAQGGDEGQDRRAQPHLPGPGPADPEVLLSKDVDALQRAHPRVRRARRHLHHLPGLRRHPAERRGARNSKIDGVSIADACAMQITDLAVWVDEARRAVGRAAARDAAAHAALFVEIGLGYLSLDRPAGTLSGGESQRTKMIRHLGSSLTDVTYVFDEPTIGLHPHDIQRMNELLLRLRDKGNTVLVVEHKPEAIAIADHVVDLGPGAGSGGGTICFEGTFEALRESDTLTGRHIDDRASLKEAVRTPSGALEVRGATTHNLRASTSTSRSACSSC
jgi:excinuclease UvrABC ATPase subunit